MFSFGVFVYIFCCYFDIDFIFAFMHAVVLCLFFKKICNIVDTSTAFKFFIFQVDIIHTHETSGGTLRALETGMYYERAADRETDRTSENGFSL